MAVRPTAPNVLSVYRRASAEELAEGLAWYGDAHTVARALDPDNVARAAGVLSALSPRVDWERNVALAGQLYATGDVTGCLGASADRARRILAGAPVDTVLRGPKTRAFAHLITDPTADGPVVVDRHAFDVAVGSATDDVTREQLARVGAYDRWARAFRRAADTVSAEAGHRITPAQVQAVTWVTWRNLPKLSRNVAA